MKFLLIAAFALAPLAPALADDIAPMALNSLPATPANLASAKVENPKGQMIGEVSGLVTDAAGHLSAVKVAEANGTTTIPAAAASYDAQRNIVVADAVP